MPLPLASLAVTAGQTYTVSVGSRGTVGAVVIANESPYSLQVSTGSGGLWIVAQTADLVFCDSTAFNGNLTITTDNYLSNSNAAPSFLVYLTSYAPGETIRGTYPAPLMRLTNGAVGVATQVINDNNSLGTTIIEAAPTGSAQSYVLVRNDGTFQIWSISNNVLTELINVTPGTASTPAALLLKLLEVLGATQLDSGHIYTDGNGNLTVGITAANSTVNAGKLALWNGGGGAAGLGVPSLSIVINGSNVTGGAVYTASVAPGAGVYFAHQFTSIVNGSQVFLFQIGAPQGGAPPLSWIDGAGVLHASGPLMLASGNQETSNCGFDFPATVASQACVVQVPFHARMSNTPTSITLTGTNTANATAAASSITTDGFLLTVTAVAAGQAKWFGTYTTVGN